MDCDFCKKEQFCTDCSSLIDGIVLQRKLTEPRRIVLETKDGDKFYGDLFLVSPVGLGIKIPDIVPSDWYIIRLHDNLCVKVRKIGRRGKEDYHGFDILEVQREYGSTSRLNNDEYRALTMTPEQIVDEATEALPENIRNIVQERLKTELEKAKIFDSLKVGQTIKYQKGNFKPLSKEYNDVNISQETLTSIAERCSKTGLHQRELLIDKEKVFDIHGIPFDYQSGGILILDVTTVVKNEREQQEKEKKIYREAIEAVTGGKLRLVNRKEISLYISSEQPDFEMKVSLPQEMDSVRLKIETMLNELGVPSKETFLYTVCVSEAMTNAIKYAHCGTCKVWLNSQKIFIEVSDNGPGISFKDLPKATLMQHFSTTNSLGCGFTIMLKFLDKITMATDSSGTTLILEKNLVKDKLMF